MSNSEDPARDPFEEPTFYPDAVAVLGCRLQAMPDDERRQFTPADHTQADANGMLAGNFRVDGAVGRYLSLLRQRSLDATIDHSPYFIFTGGVTAPINADMPEVMPTEAAVFLSSFHDVLDTRLQAIPEYGDLVTQYGLPVFKLEAGSKTTGEGLGRLATLAVVKVEKIEVLTNTYHVPRCRLITRMILAVNDNQDLATMQIDSAEHHANQAFNDEPRRLHDLAYGSDIGLLRIHQETAGIALLYNFAYDDPEANVIIREKIHQTKPAEAILQLLLTAMAAHLALDQEGL